jgi:hypothetical protein
MKNCVSWDVKPCRSCKNRRFGGTWCLHHQGDKNMWTRNNVSLTSNFFLRSVRRLLVMANVVPSSPILVTLMMEALRSSETSVHKRAIRRIIPEDAILHSHRRGNHKSYRRVFPEEIIHKWSRRFLIAQHDIKIETSGSIYYCERLAQAVRNYLSSSACSKIIDKYIMCFHNSKPTELKECRLLLCFAVWL